MPQPSTTLIFPDTMIEGVRYGMAAINRNENVIGAAVTERCDSPWLKHATLPLIYDQDFENALLSLIQNEAIKNIYCPHRLIWNFLSAKLPLIAPEITLLPDTWDTQRMPDTNWGYSDLLEELSPLSLRASLDTSSLQFALHHAETISGQSCMEKLTAFLALASDLPCGDILEIGSFHGRSAFILAWLARRYQIGNVLSIDPWDREEARQDVPRPIQSAFDLIDYNQAFNAYLANLTPCFWQSINYLRLPSTKARQQYYEYTTVTTPEFGTTQYKGQTSLVHIDGNHDYKAVSQDIRDWAPTILPGGWLVIDDYDWPFGNGPRCAGDEFLINPCFSMGKSLVIAGALFIQRGQCE